MSFIITRFAARHSLAVMAITGVSLAGIPLYRMIRRSVQASATAAGLIPYVITPPLRFAALLARLESWWALKVESFFTRAAKTQWGDPVALTPRQVSLRAQLLKLSKVGIIVYFLWYVFRTTCFGKDIHGQYRKSAAIHLLVTKPQLSPDVVRRNFMDLPMTETKAAINHTHGEAAADRSSASIFIDRLAAVLGRTAYFIQRSRSDERSRRAGSRAYFWSKDVPVQPSKLVLPQNPLVAFVDVDQYVDMTTFLSTHVHPTILYTFQPSQVARVSSNYSFTFDSEDEVEYTVSGGGLYKHKVWNYSADHITAKSWFLGLPYRTASYLIDRRTTSCDHELIMLTPIGSWWGPGAMLYNNWITGRELTRLRVSNNGFLRLQLNSKDGVQISTGKAGSYNCATIPAHVDNTISAVSRTSKYDLSMPQVLSFVDGDREKAVALLEFHKTEESLKPDVLCPVELSTRRYQFDPNSYEPEAKPSMVPFMSAILNDGFCPDRSLNNEIQSIEGRVEKVRPKDITMTPFLSRVMTEFVLQLIPDSKAHKLDPTDYDEVLARQPRPTQQRTLHDNECIRIEPKERRVKMFMKAEAYGNVKDPRAISMVNGVDKRDYSMYMYAFESILKDQKWYAFGKTPKLIAQRVAKVCREAQIATNTDFSRFDGHGSNVMRELEKMVLTRAFRPKYHSEVLDLHQAQYGLKAYATLGTQYYTAFSRASGSPETSLFNTLVNAFVAFYALRSTKVRGIYNTADQAWRKLGIYGGDDGLTADVPSEVYIRAAKSIGQELTVEPINRGEMGIKFLARIYSPDVWFGDTNTCCDVPRQLAKFHMTVRLCDNVTPLMKLQEKVRSMCCSDRNTPILGDYCSAFMRINGEVKMLEETKNIRSWLSNFDFTNQYDNNRADWMEAYVQQALPSFQITKFLKWLDRCTTPEQFLSAPEGQERTAAKSAVPAVIDGEVVPYGTKLPVKPARTKCVSLKPINSMDIKHKPESPSQSQGDIKYTPAASKERKIDADSLPLAPPKLVRQRATLVEEDYTPLRVTAKQDVNGTTIPMVDYYYDAGIPRGKWVPVKQPKTTRAETGKSWRRTPQ